MIVIDERVFAIRIIDTFAIPFPGSFITCLFVTISHNVIMPRILNMLWFHISQQCGDRYATVNYIKIFIIDTNISNHTSYLTLVCELWVSVVRTLANLPTMMTSWNGNIFRATGLLWGIPWTKARDAELWCFLWSGPEPTDEQAIATLVIWDSIALIMASLQWFPHTSIWNPICKKYFSCVLTVASMIFFLKVALAIYEHSFGLHLGT